MSPARPAASRFSYNRVIIALVALMLASLTIIDLVVLKQQRQSLLRNTEAQAAVELEQAATFMTEPLLRYRFADIEQFIHQWGINNIEVVRFEAITPQGHLLTEFKRPTTSPHRLLLERNIEFTGRHLLTLRLEKDYAQTELILAQLRNRLLLASLFISAALGASLWFIFRLLAIRPLEQEITRRRLAETELAALNRSLEGRVRARTGEIAELLDLEIYLREIMGTVSDINGLLLTSPDLEALLTQACARFVRHGQYRFCWLGLLKEGAISAVYHSGARNLLTAAQAPLAAPPYDLNDRRSPFHLHPAARSGRENKVIIATRSHYPQELPPWRDSEVIAGFQQVIALPLRPGSSQSPLGVLVVYTWRPEGFEPEEITMLEELSGDLGFAIASFRHREELSRLTAERNASYEQTILTFVNMIEQRDTYTAGHTERVADYSRRIAEQMGLAQPAIERLAQAAILHDIGKIATPDAILLKPGQFTPLEKDLIRLHAVAGYEMLTGVAIYQDLAEIVLHHHERHDGTGYPDHLAGEEIPLAARILAVADAFDAMTTNRIYQPRSDVASALAKLEQESGRQFHPEAVAAAKIALATARPPEKPPREIAQDLFCADHRGLCRITRAPTHDLERERFAYFFSDQLTGLHNENYLKSTLQEPRFQTLTFCHLQGLNQFNKEQGWEQGNSILRLFADELQGRFPEAMLFRVYGNDFVIITEPGQELDQEKLTTFASLTGTGIVPQVRQLNLSDQESYSIDKLKRVELLAGEAGAD
ncbi:HD domain-containing phosphohydrolase [Desulfurivibrio sp. D14AmB]|uniref:HD domain-containing phosphohydrolase n=1 Tax=Desulfurivibrio sp. D14AmB TaxID=3374370 RepID=UPI00376ED220